MITNGQNDQAINKTRSSSADNNRKGKLINGTWTHHYRVELAFTFIALVTMLGGLIVDVWGSLPKLGLILYAIAYLTGGAFGVKTSVNSLRDGKIDIDLLMVLAAIGAAIVGEPFEGAMLLFLFSLSNVLQNFALRRTRHAIEALVQLRPSQAMVYRDKQTVLLPIERILVGDRIIVKPGERIPLDGLVRLGTSSVDQSAITGESMPVDKESGDTVFAGTINKHGNLEVEVSHLAQDSTLARLITLVEEAHSEKAETQRFIDRFEQTYATAVIMITFFAIIYPLIVWQESFDRAFYRAMTIMVAASPCALVISTPATVLSAIGNGARKGILFKGGIHVENAATIKTIAFDKTGTLTVGEPQLTDIQLLEAGSSLWQDNKNGLLVLAAAVEAKSEHHLAQAVVKAAQMQGVIIPPATNFQSIPGKGVEATVGDCCIRIGNLSHFATYNHDAETSTAVYNLQQAGKTAVIVAKVEQKSIQPLGVLGFADAIRGETAVVIKALKRKGIEHIVMLTGDNDKVATQIAAQAGIDELYANLLPEDKVTILQQLQHSYGPIAMVGDGVNDAPALATANLGIAMGAAGTDVALETADIVLMSDNLHNIPYLISLSHQTRKTLFINLGFALFMIFLMIAAILTIDLPLPLAVLGHEGGTVLVSLNGLRLLTFKGQ